ncbi:flavodoxin family protein [Microbacterium gallinarum]|uniref:NAD(P)H-dependent oxidoreductase n=1 Tax=Microbacterium gallinarum TaxID=2762209 RepID=A0ABR8X320_9MICO|nr:NAD(P)H-dependent oxidoreductase [Microbacterium gallinarum]MBD8023517.1 NAD(P)H-dependent oxidoreductase [Microbacterium gallinarum]
MLRALALNCTLKPSPSESSGDLLAQQVLDALEPYGVEGEIVRVVDFDVKPGVDADMGDGDEWPGIREKVMAADILVFATPTWMGHMSSVAQRVLERLDAELSETDDEGRPILAGKVAVVAVVGNEDGAHAIIADAYQGLGDVGFSIPSQGGVYWNGEAMHTTDYKDLPETPEKVASTTQTLARHAAHVAKVLAEQPYPAP